MSHPNRSTLRIALISAVVAVVVAFPIGVLASHNFPDVPDSNIFHADVSALVAAGVTSGCGGGNYCPSAYVTREQMAAFMNRLGALAADKTPVANATTVDRYDAQSLNRVAYNSTQTLVGTPGGSGSLFASITAPVRGWFLIWGHAAIFNTTVSGDSYGYCDLQVDNNLVPGTDFYVDAQFEGTINVDEVECSPSGGYLACPGAHSIELFADPGSEVTVNKATVMVEFVPFNGDGNPPSLFSCVAIIAPDGDSPLPAHPEK